MPTYKMDNADQTTSIVIPAHYDQQAWEHLQENLLSSWKGGATIWILSKKVAGTLSDPQWKRVAAGYLDTPYEEASCICPTIEWDPDGTTHYDRAPDPLDALSFFGDDPNFLVREIEKALRSDDGRKNHVWITFLKGSPEEDLGKIEVSASRTVWLDTVRIIKERA